MLEDDSGTRELDDDSSEMLEDDSGTRELDDDSSEMLEDDSDTRELDSTIKESESPDEDILSKKSGDEPLSSHPIKDAAQITQNTDVRTLLYISIPC